MTHSKKIWTWDVRDHPEVISILDQPDTGKDWCDQLEDAASDLIVGKVLCVCASVAIARKVVDSTPLSENSTASKSLDLLNCWIDDPTDQRFEQICSLIFDDDTELISDQDPHGVVFWALRTATSAIGCSEAGWALGGARDAAMKAGSSEDELRALVKERLLVRANPE
jgi:hypothetical protein